MSEEVVVRGVFHAGSARRGRRVRGPILTILGCIALVTASIFGLAAWVDAHKDLLVAWCAWLMMLGGFIIPSVAPFVFAANTRPRARASNIVCGPGMIRVVDANYTLLARDVIGASTALHEGGYLLSVDAQDSGTPHTFLFDDVESLDRARRSLGLEHEGTGAVEWAVGGPPLRWFAVAGAVSNLLCTGAGFAMLLVWPFLRMWPRQWRSAVRLALTPEALKYQPQGTFIQQFAYGQIAAAVYDERMKTIVLRRVPELAQFPPAPFGGDILGYLPVTGLPPFEAQRVCSQINAAARRARGDRVHRASALDRVGQIRRLAGENARSWLQRIGALAASVGGEGYRASPIDAEDLMRVAEDPDEAPEDRIAAGRTFLRAKGEGVRVRVDAALATVRAKPERIRIALDAPEEDAGEALEAITQEQPLRLAR